MGSGCNVSNNTSNLFSKKTPDTAVKYTGPAIPALNICTNDLLSEVEAVILAKIIDYSTGVGITIPNIDLTTCGAFADCVTSCCPGVEIELPDLLECYKNAICSIFEDVETLKDQMADLMNGPYNTACIAGLGTNPTLVEILQKWLLDYCTLKAQVTALQTQVNNLTTNLPTTIGNFMKNAISTCTGTGSVIESGSGSSYTVQFRGFTPVGGMIPYKGPMNKFDTNGLGLSGTDMCGWALCNGNTHTINGSTYITTNMVGQTAIGMINGMGGSVPSNYTGGPTTSMGDVIGEAKHLNTASESGTGTHTHGITDPGHDHFLRFKDREMNQGPGTGDHYVDFTGAPGADLPDYTGWAGGSGFNASNGVNISAKIGKSGTNISIQSAGSSATEPHNNIQPSVAVAWIERLY